MEAYEYCFGVFRLLLPLPTTQLPLRISEASIHGSIQYHIVQALERAAVEPQGRDSGRSVV
jgi:hypothetical protein